MDIALGLGVSYCHLQPLGSPLWFKGHDVAKIIPIVVLWLYRLMTKTSNNYFNVANVLSNTPLKPACELNS